MEDEHPDSEEMDTNQTEEELTETGRMLLTIRQKYKKVASNLVRARSHLDFISSCREKGLIPTGLRIRTRCNALLSSYSNVETRFKETCSKAEGEFMDALSDHYLKLEDELTEELEAVKEIMKSEASKIVETEEETITTHERMLEKTTDNVEALATKLKDSKVRKLKSLTNPKPKEFRRNQRTHEHTDTHTTQPRTDTRTRHTKEVERTHQKRKDTRPYTTRHHATQELKPQPPTSQDTINQIVQHVIKAMQHQAPLVSPAMVPPPFNCAPSHQPPPLFGLGGQPPLLQPPQLQTRGQQVFQYTGRRQ